MSDPLYRHHPASLLPMLAHSPQLVRLMSSRVSPEMIRYMVCQMVKIIRIEGEELPAAPGIPTPPQTPHKVTFADQVNPPAQRLMPLEEFITRLVNGANVQVSTFLSTLIYLKRLYQKIPAASKGQSAANIP